VVALAEHCQLLISVNEREAQTVVVLINFQRTSELVTDSDQMPMLCTRLRNQGKALAPKLVL
jgi:hypothetical protein